jgi:hypothetical protein
VRSSRPPGSEPPRESRRPDQLSRPRGRSRRDASSSSPHLGAQGSLFDRRRPARFRAPRADPPSRASAGSLQAVTRL